MQYIVVDREGEGDVSGRGVVAVDKEEEVEEGHDRGGEGEGVEVDRSGVQEVEEEACKFSDKDNKNSVSAKKEGSREQ